MKCGSSSETESPKSQILAVMTGLLDPSGECSAIDSSHLSKASHPTHLAQLSSSGPRRVSCVSSNLFANAHNSIKSKYFPASNKRTKNIRVSAIRASLIWQAGSVLHLDRLTSYKHNLCCLPTFPTASSFTNACVVQT